MIDKIYIKIPLKSKWPIPFDTYYLAVYAIYGHINGEKHLLYIGCSGDPCKRINQHQCFKKATTDGYSNFQCFRSRAMSYWPARAFEASLIRQYAPIYNKYGNPNVKCKHNTGRPRKSESSKFIYESANK